MIDPEIRDLKVEWVKLPGAMPGMRHLRITQTHGDNSVTEFLLTEKQGQVVGQFACAEREAKLIADTRLEEAREWKAHRPGDGFYDRRVAELEAEAHRAAVQPGGSL